MKTIEIRIPLRARDYCLFGIPYLLSSDERQRADRFLKDMNCISVLSAGPVFFRMENGDEPQVMVTVRVPSPTLKDYILEAFKANLSDDRAPVILKWLEDKNLVELGDYRTLHDDTISADGDCFYCYRSEEYYADTEDCEEVHISARCQSNTETWCQSEVNDHSFRCERSRNYFCAENFTEVDVEGDSICLEWNEDSIHHWESDGEYHWDAEEEEEEEESDGVSDYHGSPKPWKNGVSGHVFGCELEIYGFARAEVAEIAENCNLFSERDGSLDDEHGIEIIGNPMTLTQHQNKNGPWMQFLAEVQGKAKGWNAGTGYGLHVSVNREGMSNYLTGKLLVFMHGNQSFCERIAGRSANQWQVYKDKSVTDGKRDSGEKYEALAIRSRHRLECRIFRSTLKPEGFLRAVEFVAASVEFCRTASAVTLTENAFVTWLKLPENCGAYPNLSLHLGIKKPNTFKKAA